MADVSPRDRQAQATALREAGITAARAGQKIQAWRYLRRSIALDDGVEETWLWLAGVAATTQESLICLRHALAINPYSQRAQAGLRWARRQLNRQRSHAQATAKTVSSVKPSVLASTSGRAHRWSHWAGVVLVIWLIALVTGGFLLTSLGVGSPIAVLPLPTPTDTLVPDTPTPTTLQQIEALQAPLRAAWEAEDWPECARILDQIQALDSNYGGVDAWLIAVHLAWGIELAAEEQLEEALAHFEAVLALDPEERTAQEQRLLAQAYLAAQESYAVEGWEKAILQLQAVLEQDDDYLDARDLLYQSHYQLGVAHQVAGELIEAKTAYEQALAIQEDSDEAQAALAHVTILLTPPTPTPVPKRIEIYIGRDTRTGHFQVLDKIPNAYAVRWDLQMPHWLGIYHAGASENGIHALPILSNGQRLWAGFLGQRVSYGCIILGVEEARLLYEWAEVGTPVDVYP
jgi:tetratricopeptide (TPR) repeat protein